MSKLPGTLRKKGKKGTYYYRVQVATDERREFSLKTSDPVSMCPETAFIFPAMPITGMNGPVENVKICGNTFDHCAYTQDSAVPINFEPVILKKVPGFFYHGKANIHDNTFLTKDTSLVLKALSVAEINFNRNTITSDSTPENNTAVSVECGTYSAADNTLNGKRL